MAAVELGRASRGLYRQLLRKLTPLPPEAQQHYRHRIRQEFNSYSDEMDEERIKQISEQALKDVDWVLDKYTKPTR